MTIDKGRTLSASCSVNHIVKMTFLQARDLKKVIPLKVVTGLSTVIIEAINLHEGIGAYFFIYPLAGN